MAQETLSPDALLLSTNLSGSVSDIQDDPDSPDSAWLTADDAGSDTHADASFPSPSNNLSTGADLQEFRVLVRRTNNSNREPSVTIRLAEGGGDIVALISGQAVTSTSGEVISATWDASNLSNVDGSGVEISVEGSRTGGPGNQRNTVEVGAVEWNAEVTSSAQTFSQSLSATATGTPSRILGPGLNLTTSATGTASLSDTLTKLKTLAVSATGSPNLIRKMFQTVSATASGSATLSTALKFVRTLSARATAAASVATQKTRGKVLSASATGSATLSRTLTFLRTLSDMAVGSASVSLKKTLSRTLSVTVSAAPSLLRKISFTLSDVAVGQLTLSTAKTILQRLTGSSSGSASLSTDKTEAGTTHTFTQTLAVTASATPKLVPWGKNPAGRPYRYVGNEKRGAERSGPDFVRGKVARLRKAIRLKTDGE